MAVVMNCCYFFLLFLFLSNISLIVNSQLHHHHHHHHVCDPKQSLALLQFKNSFSPPIPLYPLYYLCNNVDLDDTVYESTSNYRMSKWNESTDCCLWDGVECDDKGQGHVVGLHLGCSLLQGPLHPNSTLFTLSHLQTLNLSYNEFLGSPISPQFGIMLTKLRVLDLSYSSFQGQVPMQISYLSNLVSLNLSSYNSRLSISNEVMNQLVHNLTNIRDLQLAYTNLLHITPNSFINISLSLRSLDLSYSYLSGNFPNHIFSFPNLNVLNLLVNYELNGYLPMSNWSKSLQILDLSFTNFSGEIPYSISEVKVLRHLDLGFCNFNGEVPNFETHSNPLITGQLVPNCVFNNITQQTWSSNSFTNVCINTPLFPNLIHVILKRNSFTGIIPSWIYLLPNLKRLDLSDNDFSGFMGDFRSNSLEYLVLSNNNLQGEISKSIYRQLNLIDLGLNSNNISGVLNLDMLLRIPSLWNLQISNNSQLSIFSTNGSFSNLTYIGMAYLNLGKIPYFLRNQKNLESLDLSVNQIVGKIPRWFCELGNLMFLDLSHNSLSGELPSCLSNMTKLRTLILKSNNFSGVIPIPPSIVIYIASENQFVGKIPHSICLALDLEILSLSNNRMSGGTIPSCLTNITFLSVLDLKGNNFIGTIPTTLFPSGCQLQSLDLNGNRIEGELPQSLLNCKDLQVLDLGNNNITGYFPYWLKAVLNLQVLILRSNRFYGHINNSFTKDSFSNLQIIDLSHNYFSGPLPSKFFNNMRAIREVENQKSNFSLQNYYYRDSIVISLKGLEQSLEINLFIWKTIDLSSNDFNGEIPKEIGTLRSLVGLNLSHNKLRGGIPTSLGNLSNLEWLDLSSNELFGSIPPQLVSLTFLSCLNLSQNQLSGPIPKGKQFDTFENSSYFGNIGLCGNPLPKCDADQNDHKSQLLQKEEEEDDSSEKGIWVKAVFTGYGCGIVFGIFIAYVVFKCGRPMWIVAKVEGKRAQKIQTSKKNNKPRRRNE